MALGAYTTAYLRHGEAVRVEALRAHRGRRGAALAAVVVAVRVGVLCVRYVKIYFGMLALAFGMLFYSFLYKFYALTGGDEGIRVLRPTLLGQPLAGLNKVEFLTGPFYYYALALLVLAALIMRRIVRSPFGLCLRAIRESRQGRGARRERPATPLRRFRDRRGVGAVGGTLLAVPDRPGRSAARLLDPLRQSGLHAAARRLRPLSWDRWWAP